MLHESQGRRLVLRLGGGRRRGGWSLIELLIAIATLALLLGIALPLYGSYTERARVARAVSDIRMIEGAVERYRVDFGSIPLQIAPLIKPLPLDPWGNPYEFLNIQSGEGQPRKDKNLVPLNSDYDIYSKGKDGESKPPLTPKVSQDDVVRANDGKFVGLAAQY